MAQVAGGGGGGGAIDERDMALAMHETFLGSGSEDALSPRFQNLDIRSTSSASASSSPRTPPPPHHRFSPTGRGLERIRSSNNSSSGGGTTTNGVVGDGASVGKQLADEGFVKRLRETEFELHDRRDARLNNGSFGSCPKTVRLNQEAWAQKWLKQPDAMYYGPLKSGLEESRRVVAAHVNSPIEELVLLDNVTTAASIVGLDVMWRFAEGRYQKGDSILMINFAYMAVRIAFEAYAARAGAHILIADIPFPVSSADEILRSFETVLQRAKDERRVIRLAVFDHIVSMPSIILPVKELIALCRRYGVEEIFVDGAQAVGNLKLDMKDIDADYYSGNLHKWYFAPTAVAFFHCKPQHLERLHHPVASWHYGEGLVEECRWVGTRDFSPMLAVPAAFEFMSKLPGGFEAVRARNHEVVVAAARMLAEAWGTSIAVSAELSGAMSMVGLPAVLGLDTHVKTLALRTRFREEYAIEVHTYTLPSNANANAKKLTGAAAEGDVTAYLRISHQIYNTWDEYVRLRDAVNAIVAEKKKSNE